MDTGLDALKTASKNVVPKAAEVTGEFIRNKIADAVAKSNDDKIVKTNPVEEIIIPPEKKRANIKRIKTSVIKIGHYKISKLLNDSSVSKFLK